MTSPRVEIDLGKIRSNTRTLVQRLQRRGITTLGVTKAVCGHSGVANAMLSGGVSGLADARISNVERMRKAGITAPITLIRTPMVSQTENVVRHCEVSYNTEIAVIEQLGVEALKLGRVHSVILMVEMGDLRDGVPPDDLAACAIRVMSIPGVALKGIAANFTCLGHIAPDQPKMSALSALAKELEGICGPVTQTVSGGGSVCIPWATQAPSRGRVNELRLGEAILLGLDPMTGGQIEGLRTDAFALKAEVIETKIKQQPLEGFEDRCSFRSILAIGCQDVDPASLHFPPNITLMGATSDHMVVESTTIPLKVGSECHIGMGYNALMRAMSAPDVAKVVLDDRPYHDGAVEKATVLS